MLQIDDKKSKQQAIERLLAKAQLKDREDKVVNKVRLLRSLRGESF